MGLTMKLDLPGLWKEELPSGTIRWRVRVEGSKRKITLAVTPDDPDFFVHYRAARAGEKAVKRARPVDVAKPKTVSWLTHAFEAHMKKMVDAGDMHPSTLHQRGQFYARLRAAHGGKDMRMPKHKLVEWLDGMIATPGAQKNAAKAVRACYKWAVDRGHVQENPASSLTLAKDGGGATPWTVDDLTAYRERHPRGTMAHLALTLFMFTACRIGDGYRLGRRNEVSIDGVTWLDWQPAKKGSARVVLPMAPPLVQAVAAQKVVGPTYLLTAYGQPFSSAKSFANRFEKWCEQAGIKDRSTHGIRKAAGELMALSGVSQYHIMAVHGHTQAKTSEVYTSGVNRRQLAAEAMRAMDGMGW